MRTKLISICVLLCLLSAMAFAQTITGSVTGTVTDASGAAMANVKVTATNTGTGIANTTQTNASGIYNFPFLPVGEYNVAAENQGFKKAVIGPFRLEVNQTARLDVKLEVGDISQSVEVTEVGPLLQTETQATGDTLS